MALASGESIGASSGVDVSSLPVRSVSCHMSMCLVADRILFDRFSRFVKRFIFDAVGMLGYIASGSSPAHLAISKEVRMRANDA